MAQKQRGHPIYRQRPGHRASIKSGVVLQDELRQPQRKLVDVLGPDVDLDALEQITTYGQWIVAELNQFAE